MALADVISSVSQVLPITPFRLLIVVGPLLFISGLFIERIYFHSLSHIPGPLLSKITSLWIYYHSYIGDEPALIEELHQKYGPIVRICPNQVDIADGDALKSIYVASGGFRKAPCYANYDIDGHRTLFSAMDPEYRWPRAKAVLPLFSSASIRANTHVLEECIDAFVERMKAEAATRRSVNVLNLSRSLSLDVVSAYLFGKSYGGVKEAREQLSASQFVNSFVSIGRFFFLPNWIFKKIEKLTEKLFPDKEVNKSKGQVDTFVARLVDEAVKAKANDTYQGGMLQAGIAKGEVEIQLKDVIFAGTDSTGTVLSTLCWNLARNPEQYRKLRKEVLEAKAADPKADPQTLPYLRAVMKEAFRTSMANPARLPRVVPPGGWTFKFVYLPPGAIVSCQMYSLHLNPTVFPQPLEFKPERWLDPSSEMTRDLIPFGIGTRQCIARNLATVELFMAVQRIAEEDCLKGVKAIGEQIERLYWFNSKVRGQTIDLVWE